MGATRLGAVERVDAQQLGELEEVRDAASPLERLVKLLVVAEHARVGPELLAELRYAF